MSAFGGLIAASCSQEVRKPSIKIESRELVASQKQATEVRPGQTKVDITTT